MASHCLAGLLFRWREHGYHHPRQRETVSEEVRTAPLQPSCQRLRIQQPSHACCIPCDCHGHRHHHCTPHHLPLLELDPRVLSPPGFPPPRCARGVPPGPLAPPLPLGNTGLSTAERFVSPSNSREPIHQRVQHSATSARRQGLHCQSNRRVPRAG